jgi:hypothetical protein
MKSFKVATKLREAPIGTGKSEYDIAVDVEEEQVLVSSSNVANGIRRQFTLPELHVPPGLYFAEMTIDDQLYTWDIRVGHDPAPARLRMCETRFPSS